MLHISEVAKSFEKVQALKGVSLRIEKGEFFGLLGPNGAGKTTLLNIIVGFLEPDAGHVYVDGEAMVYGDASFRRRFGYVPQEIALYKELSAVTNLEIFGELYGLKGSELRERINWALNLVGLSERRKDKVKTFSGGMQRRLNLACSLLHEPDILLCDEPTVGVDPQSRNAIFEMLKRLNTEEGKTIIYTTHYMEEAERLCNRMAIIDHGEIIAEGTLHKLVGLLDKKATIKILKEKSLLSKAEDLSRIGNLREDEFYFEILPEGEFKKNSVLFGYLETLGIPDEKLEYSGATLEDVFLALTGRRLRD